MSTNKKTQEVYAELAANDEGLQNTAKSQDNTSTDGVQVVLDYAHTDDVSLSGITRVLEWLGPKLEKSEKTIDAVLSKSRRYRNYKFIISSVSAMLAAVTSFIDLPYVAGAFAVIAALSELFDKLILQKEGSRIGLNIESLVSLRRELTSGIMRREHLLIIVSENVQNNTLTSKAEKALREDVEGLVVLVTNIREQTDALDGVI